MKSLEQTIKDVERDLVINLVISVKYKRISFAESKKIAKDCISYFPFKDYEDLFERLYFLSNSYREVRKVYVKYSPAYYEERSKAILEILRNNMKGKDYGKT